MAADINGDGKLDLVVGGGGTATSIFLGNGDGSFQAAISQLPFGPIAVGDVNGDGKPDLVIVGSPFLGVYLGEGDGTFTTLNVNYLIGLGPGGGFSSPPLVADFNGDGKLDVGVDSFLLLGNGDGTFRGNLLTVGGISFVPSWLSADFNGDGNLDIALIQNPENRSGVSVLLGGGAGQFVSAPGTVVPESSTLSLSMGDFNGDGKLDLLVAGLVTSETAWRYSVLLGNGDGTFRPPITSAPQSQEQVTIVVADFNGDHISDFASLSDFGVGLYLGKGDGTFAAPVFFALTGSSPGSLVAGDFNNDGNIDIVATVVDGIDILLGNGDGTFEPAVFAPYNFTQFNAAGHVVAAVDLDGDGNLDLLLGGPFAITGPEALDINADVLLGNGDGTFGTLISNQVGLSQNNSAVGIADVNGDGKLDLVTSNSQGLQIALGNGDGTFAGASTLFPPFMQDFGGLGQAVLVADFNKDGRPDIAITESARASGLVVLFNNAPPPTPDFLIAVKPLRPATLAPGSSATSTVTLTAVGGFSASVALSCTGLPNGARCGFVPPALPAASGTSALTISTTSATPDGNYPVTIVAASGGLTHQRVATFSLAGSGPDFSATAAATSTTVTPGQMATYTISVDPSGGFAQTVALACTGAPALSTCTVSPSSVALSGAAQTASVSITTTAAAAMFRPAGWDRKPGIHLQTIPGVLALSAMGLLIALFLRQGPGRRRAQVIFGMLLCAAVLLTSCGGGSSSGVVTGTPTGTYTIAVAGTFTSGATTLTHQTNLTLVVQ